MSRTTAEILAAYRAYAETPEQDHRFELFNAHDIRRDLASHEESIKNRREELEERRQVPEDEAADEFTIEEIEGWLKDDITAWERIKEVRDFLVNSPAEPAHYADTPYVLFEKLPLSPEDEKMFMEQEFGDWFGHKPILYLENASEADRAEAFFNALARN